MGINTIRGRPPRLIHETVERVRETLLAGKKADDSLPSERELVRMFGVSRDTIRAVMAVLEERRAVVKHSRRGWYVGKTHTVRKEPLLGRQIGLSFSGGSYILTDSFRMEVLSGLAKRMHESGMNLLLCTRDWRWKEHKPPAAHFSWPNILGLFLLGRHPAWVFESLHALPLPLIALDTNYTVAGVRSVCFDNRHAGRLLASRLHKLGHRRIAMIVEDPSRSTEKRDESWFERRAAFAEGAVAAGLPPPIEIRLSSRDNPDEGIALLAPHLAQPPMSRPTAVCVPHPGFLTPLREACMKQGLLIPRDLTVVGYRHRGEAGELTSICFDGKKLGNEAILWMEQLIEHGTPRKAGTLMRRVKGAYTAGLTHGRISI